MSKSRRVAEESAKGLIEIAGCEYKENIIERKNMAKKLGESEYSFKYVMKSLSKKCPSRP